jgi:hypothetical protein
MEVDVPSLTWRDLHGSPTVRGNSHPRWELLIRVRDNSVVPRQTCGHSGPRPCLTRFQDATLPGRPHSAPSATPRKFSAERSVVPGSALDRELFP